MEAKTKEQVASLVDEIAEAVEVHTRSRQTMLDLDKLRWPIMVKIQEVVVPDETPGAFIATDVPAVADRFGRLYIPLHQVMKKWLTPGFRIWKPQIDIETGRQGWAIERIMQQQVLSIDESDVCYQVSTMFAEFAPMIGIALPVYRTT